MAVYLVAIELRSPNADYAPAIGFIKNISGAWMYYIPHAVLIRSNETAEVIARKIFPYITKEDYLLVIRVTKEFHGWLPKEAWDWLDKASY
jgi:hypothetical protein